MENLVSVLIPVYNAERYIKRTIKSILNQTYNNWELIIINDGSTDNSEKIIREFCKKDNRIKLYSQNNKGLVETRKALLQHVKGDYWMFIDADDFIHPQMLDVYIHYVLMDKANIDIVMCDGLKYVSKRFGIGKVKKKIYVDNISYHNFEAIELLENFIDWPKYSVDVHGRLYSSRLLKADFNLVPRVFLGENLCFCLILFKEASRVIVLNERMYNYRVGGGSAHFRPYFAQDTDVVYKFRKEFIINNEYDKKLLASNLHNALGTLRALALGNVINGREVYNALKYCMKDIDLLTDEKLKIFYMSMKDNDAFRVPADRKSIVQVIKEFVLKYL